MWCFDNGMAEMYVFETREDGIRFIREATIKNIERVPDDPDQWCMIPSDRDVDDCLFEIKFYSVEEALKRWFGDDVKAL